MSVKSVDQLVNLFVYRGALVVRGIKSLVFHFYWPAILAVVIIAFVFLDVGFVLRPGASEQKTFAIIVGLLLGFAYFLQRQKLAEAKFFLNAYEGFNKRYEALNKGLEDLKNKKQLTPDDEAKVIAYFNLCAEEYLLFRQGYIPNAVWISWRNGMREYFQTPIIRKAWEEEQKTNSYYRFDPETLGLFD